MLSSLAPLPITNPSPATSSRSPPGRKRTWRTGSPGPRSCFPAIPSPSLPNRATLLAFGPSSGENSARLLKSKLSRPTSKSIIRGSAPLPRPHGCCGIFSCEFGSSFEKGWEGACEKGSASGFVHNESPCVHPFGAPHSCKCALFRNEILAEVDDPDYGSLDKAGAATARPTSPAVGPPATLSIPNINTPVVATMATAPAAAVPRLPPSQSTQMLTE